MAEIHIVEQGECLSSIGAAYKMDWHKIWNDSHNADLKSVRKNPNVLFPGDEVFIPDNDLREESCATERVHKFVLKAPSETLRIRLLDEFDRPRKQITYELVIGGHKGVRKQGTTDDNGELQEDISPLATQGRLFIGNEREEVVLCIGSLDPVTEITGIQGRLSNLGYNPGPIDGILGSRTREAISDFQDSYELDVTGEPNDATGDKLRELHGH